MNPSPFFSIIIPLFNKAPHVSRSIRSVLDQTFNDFELIIVNDASTDYSLEEVFKFTDTRIRIFHRSDSGPGGYAARNLGIKKANAKWIAFLDADDEWRPDHLLKMKMLMKQFPYACILGCGWIYNDPDRIDINYFNDHYFTRQCKYGNHFLSFKDYLQNEIFNGRPIWTSVACIFKKVLLDIGGFPENKCKRGGDVNTWLRCVEYCQGMAWSRHIGAIYHRDSINMVTRTEFTTAKIDREVVRELIPIYTGDIVKLLMQYSNRRTIDAWAQNYNIPKVKNFSLLGRLYFKVDVIKTLGYFLLSFLPRPIFLFFRKTYRRGRMIIEKHFHSFYKHQKH